MTILYAVLATAFTYALPAGQSRYQVTILYDGYLPVMGGMEQKAKAEIGLLVESKNVGEATTVLDSLSLALRNLETGEWAVLPFTAENVKEFFPASTIKHEPNGKIVSTNMPKSALPFRLPGLDLQHIPDVTFMLLEFPVQNTNVGDEWQWARKFGDSPVKYTSKYKGKDDIGHRFDLRIEQEYESKEDENNNPTQVEAEMAMVVKTSVRASGTVWFSGLSGWISRAEVNADAVSNVYSLKAGEPAGLRRLRMQFRIEHKGEKNEGSKASFVGRRGGADTDRIHPGRHYAPAAVGARRYG